MRLNGYVSVVVKGGGSVFEPPAVTPAGGPPVSTAKTTGTPPAALIPKPGSTDTRTGTLIAVAPSVIVGIVIARRIWGSEIVRAKLAEPAANV